MKDFPLVLPFHFADAPSMHQSNTPWSSLYDPIRINSETCHSLAELESARVSALEQCILATLRPELEKEGALITGDLPSNRFDALTQLNVHRRHALHANATSIRRKVFYDTEGGLGWGTSVSRYRQETLDKEYQRSGHLRKFLSPIATAINEIMHG